MSKAEINALRSVDLGFADPDKALQFFTKVWNLDHWGVNAGPSERMEAAGLRYKFTDDGWRLDEWR